MKTRSITEQLSKLSLLVMAMLILFASGCNKSAQPPPVVVTYRDSLFGIGKVIQITNNSSYHLYNVCVIERNYDEVSDEVSAHFVKVTNHLRPYDTVEVGWLEFESWIPRPGETVGVCCDDYVMPFVSIIPE